MTSLSSSRKQFTMAKLILITSCVHLIVALLLIAFGFVNRFAHIKEYPRYYYEHSFRYVAAPVWTGFLAMTTSILGILIGSRFLSQYRILMVQLFKALCVVSGGITFFVLLWSGNDLSSQAQWVEMVKDMDPDESYKYDKDDKERLGVTAAIVTLSVLELFLCSFSALFNVNVPATVGTYQVIDSSNAPATSIYNMVPVSEVSQMTMMAPGQQTDVASSPPNTLAYAAPYSGATQMMLVPVQQTVPVSGFQCPQV